ncbi:MAG: RNHCP domain-containing protein [Clostridia bacterium]|nr:RNHCP domain-containing protein [Clostridia bacterium]
METKRFSKNDNGFICAHCGAEIPPLGYTSRDHCPECLWSLHVDENPGDRACECRGELEPIAAIPDPKKEFIIVYKCTKCGAVRRNKAALRGDRPDNRKKLIALTAKGVK